MAISAAAVVRWLFQKEQSYRRQPLPRPCRCIRHPESQEGSERCGSGLPEKHVGSAASLQSPPAFLCALLAKAVQPPRTGKALQVVCHHLAPLCH